MAHRLFGFAAIATLAAACGDPEAYYRNLPVTVGDAAPTRGPVSGAAGHAARRARPERAPQAPSPVHRRRRDERHEPHGRRGHQRAAPARRAPRAPRRRRGHGGRPARRAPAARRGASGGTCPAARSPSSTPASPTPPIGRLHRRGQNKGTVAFLLRRPDAALLVHDGRRQGAGAELRHGAPRRARRSARARASRP